MGDTEVSGFEFCRFCGDITVGDEEHDCMPFRYPDPSMVQLVKIEDLLERIAKLLDGILSEITKKGK